MKVYKMISKDFGWKFSFNAKNDADAQDKVWDYSDYHSMHGQFSYEETDDTSRIHNEYVD